MTHSMDKLDRFSPENTFAQV